MSAPDPTVIFLQPACCADPDTGRLWCEDADPVDCPDGERWTPYVRGDLFDAQASVIRELSRRVNEIDEAAGGPKPSRGAT